QKALLLGIGSVSSGIVQPILAWFSDRYDSRVPSIIGLLVAVLGVSFIGSASSFAQLVMIQVVATAGIGAYHPGAAATAGQLARRRSLGISIFFLAGMAGGVCGNSLSPLLVDHFAGRPVDLVRGLHSLRWLIIPGLVCVAILTWAIRSVPHRAHDSHARHVAMDASERRARWRGLGVVYLGNIIRFTVNMALVSLFIDWADGHVLSREGVTEMTSALSVHSSKLNGILQGSMQVGMGAFGIMLGVMLSHRTERRAMIVVPFLGAGAIMLVPLIGLGSAWGPTMAVGCAILAGAGFGGVIPISISMAQRLVPHHATLATGIVLGGGWVVAASGPALAGIGVAHVGLGTTFVLSGIALSFSGIVSWWLPREILDD
ncbi:MAG: MFS transporter, partial [Phycisphaerales bacterium]|nr:MFS transporter [Phycisphaerales bacterium]